MICPKCREATFVVEYDGVELDRCPSCEGTWFDADELALLFSEGSATGATSGPVAGDATAEWVTSGRIAELPEAQSDEKPRRCPRCNRKMRKVNIGPSRRVLIDACPRGDGLWFDADEVAELARDLSRETGELPHRVAAFLGESLGGSAIRRRKDGER